MKILKPLAIASCSLLAAATHAADLKLVDWYQTADVSDEPAPGEVSGVLYDNGDGTYSGAVTKDYIGWADFGGSFIWEGILTYNSADNSLSATGVSCEMYVDSFLDTCGAYLTEGRSTLEVTEETPSPWMVRTDTAAGFDLQWHTSDAVGVVFHYSFAEVPVPAAAWLFGSALLGLGAVGRRKATR